MKRSTKKPAPAADLVALAEKRNVANILRRQLEGKPISKAQLAILAEHQQRQQPKQKPAPATTVGSIKGLAEALGVSRPTVYKMMRDSPDAFPKRKRGRWNIEDVRAFVDQVGTKSDDTDGGTLAERKRNWKLRNEALEMENAIRRGEYLRKADVLRELAGLVAETISQFRQKFSNELPTRLVGLEAREIRTEMDGALDAVLKKLNEKTF